MQTPAADASAPAPGREEPQVAGTLRALRVVVAALLAGVAAFAAVVFYIKPLGDDPEMARVLLGALLAVALGGTMVYPLIRRATVAKLANSPVDPSPAELCESFSRLTILGAAIAESCALLGMMTHLLTGSLSALVAVGLACVVLAGFFPTDQRWQAFMAHRGGTRSP